MRLGMETKLVSGADYRLLLTSGEANHLWCYSRLGSAHLLPSASGSRQIERLRTPTRRTRAELRPRQALRLTSYARLIMGPIRRNAGLLVVGPGNVSPHVLLLENGLTAYAPVHIWN